ncbi:MAG: DNA-binding response regulator [Calditrichaeota bacterium]|nr:MAG: DNA-binding response regulator [Calditrichota bacterium]
MEKKKILVVEDTPELVYQYKIRLNAAGFEVHTAADGNKGLEMARSIYPDLILLDLMLPEVDGYRICRFIKFDKEFEHIPIIIVTARSLESDTELAMEAGADAYYVKPVNWQELLINMNDLISANERNTTKKQAESNKQG